jgi:hypothetical protein
MILPRLRCIVSLLFGIVIIHHAAMADVGVGAKPIDGAEMLIDGSREMLDQKWKYWEGPGFKSSMLVVGMVLLILSPRKSIVTFDFTLSCSS